MACGPLPLTTSLTVMASWCGGNSFDWRAAAKGAHIPHAAPDGLSPMVAGRAPMKEDCLPKEKADVTPLMPPTGTLALREKRLRRVAGWSGALASLFGISPCSVERPSTFFILQGEKRKMVMVMVNGFKLGLYRSPTSLPLVL